MSSAGSANLILHSGKIITLDDRSRICDAVAIAGNRILHAGSDEEVLACAAPGAEIVDLAGRAVVPGLIDAHAHLDREGLKEVFPSLAGARSIDDILQRIADLVRGSTRGEWVVTMPIGDPPFYEDPLATIAEGRYPTRYDLDRVAPDNPVYIRPVWGYWREGRRDRLVSVANSRALAVAGITRTTAPPSPAVTIDRDPVTGDPTGIFIESTATPVVELTLLSMIPGFTREVRIEALRRGLETYNAVGTTGIFEGHGVSAEVLRAYQELRRRGALSVRARLVHSPSWQTIGDADPERFLSGWAGWLAHGLGDSLLRVAGLYAEFGPSPEALACARAHPYTGWAGFYYDCGLSRERQIAVLTTAARLGIRVSAISIGFLDIYEAVHKTVPIRDRRWVIQHVGHLTAGQIARIRDLGLVVSPLSISNIYKGRASGGAGAAPPPPDSRLMPLKSLVRAGVPVGLVTDNLPASLFHAIWHAVARRDRNGALVGPEDERLSREEALRAATQGGACFTFEENERGMIADGRLADLAILSHDPLTCPEDSLRDIVAERTIVDGRCVYRRSSSR